MSAPIDSPACTCGHLALAHGKAALGPYAGACLAVVPSGEPDALNRFTPQPCPCRAFEDSSEGE